MFAQFGEMSARASSAVNANATLTISSPHDFFVGYETVAGFGLIRCAKAA